MEWDRSVTTCRRDGTERNGTERGMELGRSVELSTEMERNGTERNGTWNAVASFRLEITFHGTERNGTERNAERHHVVPS